MNRLRHPVRAIREPFGTAGLVVAMVALIAALGGTALAAKGALTGKQKKEVEKIAKKFAGASGPAGPQGPAGAKGDTGSQGPKGDAGAKGDTGSQGPKGDTGAKGPAGSAGAVGETGPTGPAGPEGTFGNAPLQPGVTETGYWAFSSPGLQTIEDGEGNLVTVGSERPRAQISFPSHLGSDGLHIHQLPGGGEVNPIQIQGFSPQFEEKCVTEAGGSGSHPKAPPGYMCVWGTTATTLVNAKVEGLCKTFQGCEAITEPGEVGGYLEFSLTGEGEAHGAGSWAITEETAGP